MSVNLKGKNYEEGPLVFKETQIKKKKTEGGNEEQRERGYSVCSVRGCSMILIAKK
jgi:hypothetical protein